MRLRLSVLALIAIVVASCSSGAEESGATSSPGSTQETLETTTTEPATDTTNASPTASDDEFCDTLRRQEDEEIDVNNPEEVEATLRAAQERLSELVDDAPAEIRPAFVEFVEASERAMQVYAEYDFDLFAVPVSEIEAVQAASMEAQNQVVEFCGMDDLVDEPADEGDASGEGDVPEELFAPPGLEESSTSGIMTMMSSSAPYEDVVDYYAELVGGEPRVLSDTPGEREVTMSGDSSGAGPPSFILWVQEDGGRVIVTVSVPESS
ncbi:MAG: hypothetical protein ACLFVZ_00670 [Actinomycetota bacterium]